MKKIHETIRKIRLSPISFPIIKYTVPSLTLTAKVASVFLLSLLVILLIGNVVEVKAEIGSHGSWIKKVQEMRTKREDVKVIKSNNMTPEKSPEEFLKRLRDESRKEEFSYYSFIKDVTRGLKFEERYTEDAVLYIVKQNSNTSYYIHDERIEWNNVWRQGIPLYFKRENFCITIESLKKILGEEKNRGRYPAGVPTYLYEYINGRVFTFYFDTDKKCAKNLLFSYAPWLKF